MLDNGDLQAIARLFDDRLEKRLDKMLDEKLEPIRKELHEVNAKATRTALIVENDIQTKLQVIYENKSDNIALENRLTGLEEMIRAIQ